MFGRKARRIAELEAKNEALHKMLDGAHADLDVFLNAPKRAALVNVRTNERELILTFQRGDERFELTTYLTNASNVKGLRKWAGLP